MTQIQPRSTDGRYGPVPHLEGAPLAVEMSDEEYNADGSFHYPPRPRSATQHLAFWMRVKVDDEALNNLRWEHAKAYRDWRESLSTAFDEEFYAQYDAPRPEAGLLIGPSKAKKDEWEAEREKARVAFNTERAQKLLAQRAEYIGPTDVRTVARVAGAGHYAIALTPDEQRAVMDFPVQVEGKEMTVGEVFKRYDLGSIRMTDLRANSAERTYAETIQMKEEMRLQTDTLRQALSQVNDNLEHLRGIGI